MLTGKGRTRKVGGTGKKGEKESKRKGSRGRSSGQERGSTEPSELLMLAANPRGVPSWDFGPS